MEKKIQNTFDKEVIEIQNNLVKLNDIVGKKSLPPELAIAMKNICVKKNIFYLVYLINENQYSNAVVSKILEYYLQNKESLGWFLGCCFLPPYDGEPMTWCPDRDDYYYLGVLLDFISSLTLSQKEFRDISEYHLRKIVDNLLMSSAFAGCGSDTLLEWKSEEFYTKLLKMKNKMESNNSIDCTKEIISRIAKLLDKNKMKKLSLYISGASSYYDSDDWVKESRINCINWLGSKNIHVLIFDLIISGILKVKGPLIVPNESNINKELSEAGQNKSYMFSGILGVIDLLPAIKLLGGIISGKKVKSKGKSDELLLEGLLGWNKEWGVLEIFKDYLLKLG